MISNKSIRNVILAGLFIIPFLAFFVSKSMLFPFITGKNFGFRIIVEVIFVLWAILAMKDDEYMPKKSWLLYSFVLFLGFLGLADLFGENPNKSFWSNFERMEGFISSIHLFMYFIVISSVLFVKKTWDKLLGTWIGSSIVMSVFGLIQLAGLATINQGGGRVDGTFGNAIYLAVFLMFTIFFTILFIVRFLKEKALYLWFLVPLAVLQFTILYYTATRGALLGLLAGLFLSMLIIVFGEKENKILKKTATGVLLGLIIFVGIFVAIKDTKPVRESPVLSRFASLSFSEIKSQGRYFIWPMAISGIKEKPLLGWGQENFNYIFNAKYNPDMYAHEQWFDRAHNTFLDWLVAGGLLTFIPFMGLFFFFLWYLWTGKSFDLSFSEKAILTGLMGAYFFQGIFVFDNLFSSILFVTLLAFSQANSSNSKWVLPKSIKLPSVRLAGNFVLVCLLLVTIYMWNVKPIKAGRDLIQGLSAIQSGQFEKSLDYFDRIFASNTFAMPEAREQLLSAVGNFATDGISEDLRIRYATLARKEIERQIKSNPKDARSYVFYGNFLRSVGLNDQALIQYSKALELSPNKQVFLFEIGSTYISKGEYDTAYQIFQEAYELAPDFYQAQVIYLLGALYAKDEAKVQELFKLANQDEIIFDQRLVNVLAELGRFSDLVFIFESRLATDRGRADVQNYISLALSYAEVGERQKAIDLLEFVADNNPELKSQIDSFINDL